MKKILIPVDFSDLARHAFELGKQLQSELQAELHFVHIVTLPSHILLTPDGELFDDDEMDITQLQLEHAQAERKLMAWIGNVQSNVVNKVLYGHVNETLLHYAQKIKADMVLMGTHGAFGMRELLNGSHAEYLAMHADMPILSLKGEAGKRIEKMVLAADFTAILPTNISLLLALRSALQAQLYLLQIQKPGKRKREVEIQEQMSAFAEANGLEDVAYAIFPAEDLEEGIVRFAANNNIDLIAIGSMQRTGLNKLINGCISADLVNHVQKPIFTFKLKDN
jgi:nucleotide-binding universal stress UspA family protein